MTIILGVMMFTVVVMGTVGDIHGTRAIMADNKITIVIWNRYPSYATLSTMNTLLMLGFIYSCWCVLASNTVLLSEAEDLLKMLRLKIR